jgi:integrase
MVAKKHQELSKHSQARADNTMRVLRALFNFAQDKYEKSDGTPVILFNPCTRLTRMKLWNRVKRRRTSIKDHQLPDWYQAVNNISSRRKPVTAESARDFLLFLLFNGCRPIEASTLTWDLVDLKDRSFVFEDTKNREDHALPLSDFTHELLSRRRDNSNGSAYVFYDEDGKNIYDIRTWTKHVIDESEVPFVPYDCRRTFATAAESLDLTSYTIKRLLNHKHSEADVTSGYIQISVDRLRKPIQRISDELLIKANA